MTLAFPPKNETTITNSYNLEINPLWWAIGDLNPGPAGYEPDALTAELMAQKNNGRDDRIRTCGPLVPNQMRYQAALHPVRNKKLAERVGFEPTALTSHWFSRPAP